MKQLSIIPTATRERYDEAYPYVNEQQQQHYLQSKD